MDSGKDLAELLYPPLLLRIFNIFSPFSKENSYPDIDKKTTKIKSYRVLKKIADFRKFKRCSESRTVHTFTNCGRLPQHCLGLLYLLDQFPRAFVGGSDVRYFYDYFGELGRMVTRKILSQKERKIGLPI